MHGCFEGRKGGPGAAETKPAFRNLEFFTDGEAAVGL